MFNFKRRHTQAAQLIMEKGILINLLPFEFEKHLSSCSRFENEQICNFCIVLFILHTHLVEYGLL